MSIDNDRNLGLEQLHEMQVSLGIGQEEIEILEDIIGKAESKEVIEAIIEETGACHDPVNLSGIADSLQGDNTQNK